MANSKHSRRGFITKAGMVGAGASIFAQPLGAQSGPGAAASASMSKGARFRASLAKGQPIVLPVVTSVLLARLTEMEGFQGAFMGGSGMAAHNALPNSSIQTITEVIDYLNHVTENTNIPIVADAENGGGSPMTTYRTVQKLERAGAAVIMIEDSVGPESSYGGKSGQITPHAVMVNRMKAALDARKDQSTMVMARINRLGKGVPEQEVLRLVADLDALGVDAFYVSGFTLDQQQNLKNRFKKPLMVGSSGPATDWHSKGVDMAYYHIDTIGLGAMHMALKEIKATGKFVEAAKMILSSDVSAKLIDQAVWLERAKRYGLA